MSQGGKLKTGTLLAEVETLTSDAGGAIPADSAYNINLLGGNNLTGTGVAGTSTITFDVTGTLENRLLIGNATGSIDNFDAMTDGQLLIGSTGNAPTAAELTSSDGTVVITNGAGSIDLSVIPGSTLTFSSADGSVGITSVGDNRDLSAYGLDQDNMLYVGKHGSDANSGKTPSLAKLTIQAAVTAASVGDTIIVYPGIYTETITHAANGISIFGQGDSNNCIIRQADANVIDFNSRTDILYKFFRIECTAATTAINTIQGTTGSAIFKDCYLKMVSSTAIVAANQPAVAAVTGAGTLQVTLGKIDYYHTGACGGTAIKSAFIVGDGALIDIIRNSFIDISCSGTALVTSLIIDQASTGTLNLNTSNVSVTDPDATVVVGLGYLGGTGLTHEYYRNNIVVVVGAANTGYGYYAGDTATTSRFYYNHINVTDAGGSSYSYFVGATATVVSHFDDILAADGANISATGIFTEVSSEIDGNLTLRSAKAAGTELLTIANYDNTATASNAALNLSVGGTTSTGDPSVNWSVTGAGTFSAGIDNSDSDNWKLTTGATPSAGTEGVVVNSSGQVEFPVKVHIGGDTPTFGEYLKVAHTAVGGLVHASINNLDNTNANSKTVFTVHSGGSSAGDPYFFLGVSGVTAARTSIGIDNSDADTLKINNGSTGPSTATVERWAMSVAGVRSLPSHPAVLAYNSADDVNQTGNGAVATVDFDTEVFDQNNDFTADTFTAITNGKYRIQTQVMCSALNGSTTTILSAVTSNRTYILQSVNPTAGANASGEYTLNGSVLADMDATDTCTITLQNTGAGADNNTINGSASPHETYISVQLEV